MNEALVRHSTMGDNAAPMWSHPDITLPHLLGRVRVFLDILVLASGYQSTGLPANWRIEDVKRALGWASFLEEVILRIPFSEEGKLSRQALDAALLDMMADPIFPAGIPKLSSKVLAEARKILISAMIQAPGTNNGQVESLITATYDTMASKDGLWDVVAQQILDRCLAVSCTKSLSNALKQAIQLPTMEKEVITREIKIWMDQVDPKDLNSGVAYSGRINCCQQWRQKSLSYALDEKTLYKISGAAVIFKASESQWTKVLKALQTVADEEDDTKVTEISELCCLQLASHKWSNLTSKLLQPCQKPCFTRHVLKEWHRRNHNLEELNSKRQGVEGYLQELLIGRELLWWKLPPILFAAALTKGSTLFNQYMSELSKYLGVKGTSARCMCNSCEVCLKSSDEVFSRLWCLRFQDQIT